jgi:hypothetical protein
VEEETEGHMHGTANQNLESMFMRPRIPITLIKLV